MLCAVCGIFVHTPSYLAGNYQYWSCNCCGSFHLNEEDTGDISAANLYDKNYFKNNIKEDMAGYMDYEKQEKALRLTFRRYLGWILPFLDQKKQNRMLDIGCAYGFFLDEARKKGVSVHGLDVSEDAIQWMEKNLGIDGTVSLSPDALEGSFDIITAFEVIEHNNDVRTFLLDLSNQLAKGGILVIVTGASDSPGAKLLGKFWWYLNPPDHCIIFSFKGLKKLVACAGFEVVEHRLSTFSWIGLNNGFLKLARIFKSVMIANLASKLPPLTIPVPHFTSQFLIARKKLK